MRLRYIVFILVLSFGLGIFSCNKAARAQEHGSPQSNARYNAMSSQLLSGETDFSYDAYRKYYLNSRYYNPVPEDVKAEILNLAYIIQTSEVEEDVAAARYGYETLVKEQLANVEIVSLALSLSKKDKRFGSVKLFERLRAGLFEQVINSGNGTTLDDAYDVISPAEARMLLSYLDVSVLQTMSGREGYYYYSMYDVEDRKTGQPRTIFVNSTFLQNHLDKLEEDKPAVLDLRY